MKMKNTRFNPKQSAMSTAEELENQQKQKVLNVVSWTVVSIALALIIFGAFFAIKSIKDNGQIKLVVNGVASQQEEKIIKQQLQSFEQQKYFTADLKEIRNKVLQQAWVDEVVVSRAWPNKIQVDIIPRHPVARWGKTGLWVSEKGDIFALNYHLNAKDMPTISGSKDKTKRMMLVFQETNRLFQPMKMKLTDLHLTDRMTWFLQFDNGMRIIVDQENTLGKLNRLSTLAKTEMKPVWSKIESFDLRYRDGLAIQWKKSQQVKYENGRFHMASEEPLVKEEPEKR